MTASMSYVNYYIDIYIYIEMSSHLVFTPDIVNKYLDTTRVHMKARQTVTQRCYYNSELISEDHLFT
jgi:hypothetical protein